MMGRAWKMELSDFGLVFQGSTSPALYEEQRASCYGDLAHKVRD